MTTKSEARDKATPPWIRKAAETIQRKYNPFSGGIQQLIEIIEKLFAVECTAPAPQPASEQKAIMDYDVRPFSQMPEDQAAHVAQWLRSNKKKAAEVRWSLYPIGMVGRWIERAICAEKEAAAPQVTPTQGKREAFKEVESFIAANGRNADIQSFVEKKICELEGTSEQAPPREFKPYMEDHEYYDPPQASPTPEQSRDTGVSLDGGNLYAEFYGKDAAGIPFKGSLSLTTECRYVRLRYSKTVYSVTGGVLTISE